MTSRHSTHRTPPAIPPSVGRLVDAHTHINSCQATTIDQVKILLDRACSAGVTTVVTVADDMESARWVCQAVEWDQRIFGALAIHPTHVTMFDKSAQQELEQLASHDRIVAIGETGLDVYWIDKTPECPTLEHQRQAFEWHIDLAKRLNKPLMIHNRDADREVLEVLKNCDLPPTVIFHCFSSDKEMAQYCVDQGWILSISGTVSFKNAHQLHQAVTVIPHDQLLVETDAPFLCPHPYRGAPNEPYCLPYTVEALAQLMGITPEELARITTENARRIYQLP